MWTSSSSRVALAILLVFAAGCARLFPRSGESRDPSVNASHYRALAVIAGNTTQNDAAMASRVREEVSRIVNVVRVRGVYATAHDATAAICTSRGGDAAPDGIVVVEWNRLTLHDCASGVIAYDVTGGYQGTDYLADKLVSYLKGEAEEK